MTASAVATDYSGFARPAKGGRHSLHLAVEGMHCPACAFRIEKALNSADVNARVNVTEKRLALDWSGDISAGNSLVEKVEGLGFRFSPVAESVTEDDAGARALLRYMAVSGFASGNIMIFSLAFWFSTRDTMGGSTTDMMRWYSALVALPSVIYAGQPFFKSAFRALRSGRSNMDIPIAVAVILACASSLFETITHGPHVYFDSAVMLLFLLLVGRYLDVKMRTRARSAAGDLLALMTGTASIMDGDSTRRVPAGDVIPGMMLLVVRGDKILADGVSATEATVDASAITGETLPQVLKPGEPLLAGMINVGDPLKIHVQKSQGDSLMGDIIALMQKAEQGGAVYVRIADKISGWYTPVVHILALITFLYWWGSGAAPWDTALLYATTVLVITCPCALGLAVPVAQVVAGANLFRNGMLLKSADALERLAKVDTIVFDKTGTLTTGKIVFENKDDFSARDLQNIASMAAASHHPLARAITAVLGGTPASGAREIEGQGVEVACDGRISKLGSGRFTGSADIQDDKMELWYNDGQQAPQRLIFSDTPHGDAGKTIAQLKKTSRVVMLSGDRASVAAGVAEQLKIDDWRAGIDPLRKFDFIETEIVKGHNVLMVGDGLNDAAALSRASVSMSPSSALYITQNAADIVYQRAGVSSVALALAIARRTQVIVKENFAMALGYNVIAVPLAMAGYVTPLVAALAMSLSSLAVVGNALRLKKQRE